MLEIEEHTDMEVESVALCTETSHIQTWCWLNELLSVGVGRLASVDLH
jgi:hypothetical protein